MVRRGVRFAVLPRFTSVFTDTAENMNLKPNALIYGARYDKMMEAFGGKGYFVEDPKKIRAALDAAMKHDGPTLVNVVLSQSSTRKAQQFAWHS